MRGEDNDMSSPPGSVDMLAIPRHPRKQTNPMSSTSPDPPWQYNASAVKQEPMDDTRNDSGVTSGSECPSASPESDRSDNNPFSSPTQDGISRTPTEHFANTQSPYNAWYNNNFSTPSTSRNTENTQTPSSTELSSHKMKTSNEFDYAEISVPKVNSHGKIKVHKCKQCKFVAYTKLEFWKHSGVHIKEEKALKCPKCPFVTEFKHHLEYHIMNHQGAKPYKCELCSYSCVNNSMLRSHMKSHSKVYQYRCSNCLYETKYVHSLKLHLRKYNHSPAVVLNPDGTPNPEPVIDVYGSRRGPKTKKVAMASISPTSSKSDSPKIEQQTAQLPFNPLLLGQNGLLSFPLPLMPGFPAGLPNPEMFQSFQMLKERLEQLSKQNQQQQEQLSNEEGVLDLSKPPSRSSEVECDEEETMTTAFSNVEVVENSDSQSLSNNNNNEMPTGNGGNVAKNDANEQSTDNGRYGFHCEFCGIGFSEEVMFRIHMGYHGFGNPFTCNMCGAECGNSVNFFLHIARSSH